MKHYLLIIRGDVSSELTGPFDEEHVRDIEAAKIRNFSEEDGVFKLDIDLNGDPEVRDYSGREMDELFSQLETGDDSEE